MGNSKIETSPEGGRSWGGTPHETTLKTEDFLAPNPVLCYGGGGAFQSVAPYLAVCGINVVGVIDANRQGTVTAGGKEFPLLTLERAVALYGTDVIVMITIANESVFQQVKGTLTEHGFSENRIFDLNIWTWLTAPSEKSYCKYLWEYLQFFPASLSKCCNVGIVDAFLCEWYLEGRPLQKSMDEFLQKRQYFVEESKQGRIPLYCRNCRFLSQGQEEKDRGIMEFVVSDHAFCNADCVYCCDACTVPRRKTGASVEERYAAILYALERLQQSHLLNERAEVQLAGGEITVNPFKKTIYETVKKVLAQSPELQLEIFSNCFLYDQEIADLLSVGRNSFLMCDLDAGTPETYIKVKGFNKFHIVQEHLQKYAQYGTVKLKYVILPGWNDSQADYEGTVKLLKELGSSELMLSLEFGLSRDGNRAHIRESLYAAARFMALLEQSGIQAILLGWFWKEAHIATAKRLCRELLALGKEKVNERS